MEAAAQPSRSDAAEELNFTRCAHAEPAAILDGGEDRMRDIASILLACLLVLGAGGATVGCSSTTTTTTHTTAEPSSEGAATVQTTETKTTEQQTSGPGVGILSGTIHAIGFILALPFKIIGGLIQIIF
jgi:hypothetical protein